MTTAFSIFFVILVITAIGCFFFGRRVGIKEEQGARILVTPPILIEGLRLLSNETFVVLPTTSYRVENLFVESMPVAGKVKFQCDVSFSVTGQGWAVVNVIGVTSDKYSHAEIWREINERVGHWLPKGLGSTPVTPTNVVSL